MVEQLGVTAVMSLYCASGTLLTLTNKLAVGVFPSPNALLLLQSTLTVFLLLLLTRTLPDVVGPLPRLSCETLVLWSPPVLLFVGMLATSLLALLHVSAVTLIVIRNLCTLFVAFLERMVLGVPISTLSVAAFLGIFLGATLYGLHDLAFSAVGYMWLLCNVVCTAAFQIDVKKLISTAPGPQALGPFGMSYITTCFRFQFCF